MFKLSLATAMTVAVNAEGTKAENLWNTQDNGAFNMNTCAGEVATLTNSAMMAVEYMTGWLYCNNAAYVALDISTEIFGLYASGTYAYLAATLGTAGKAMSFCFANPVWGPCFAFMGYSNGHLGLVGTNIFGMLTDCKTEVNGGNSKDCIDNVLNIVLNAG